MDYNQLQKKVRLDQNHMRLYLTFLIKTIQSEQGRTLLINQVGSSPEYIDYAVEHLTPFCNTIKNSELSELLVLSNRIDRMMSHELIEPHKIIALDRLLVNTNF